MASNITAQGEKCDTTADDIINIEESADKKDNLQDFIKIFVRGKLFEMARTTIYRSTFLWRLINPGQEVRAGSSRKTLEINGNMEAVFRSESLRSFSVDFQLASHSFRQETPVDHRKKSENFPVGILLPFLIIFRAFPAGSSDFSASFRAVPVKFQLFSVAGIIVLGMINQIQKMDFIILIIIRMNSNV